MYRSSPPPSSAPRASFERHALPLAPPRPWLTVFPASRVSRFFPSSSKVELPKSVKPAVIAAVTNALVAMPSMAGEPGKIFDFNLTLPIIATEFLLLMVILDKTIFGPVGKALDDRDALIRDQLAAVGDNSTAVADLIVSTRERPPRRSPHTRRVFGGRTNAPGAPRAFPARPTARDRRAWRSPPDTWRLTGAREPPIGVRERLDRPLRANRRFDDSVFFSFKLPSADRSFPPAPLHTRRLRRRP